MNISPFHLWQEYDYSCTDCVQGKQLILFFFYITANGGEIYLNILINELDKK